MLEQIYKIVAWANEAVIKIGFTETNYAYLKPKIKMIVASTSQISKMLQRHENYINSHATLSMLRSASII